MFTVEGQRMLVVGGSSGIGLATARMAAELGAAVTVASRSPDKVSAAVAAIGRGTKGRTIDITDDAAVEAFFADGTVWDHVIVSAAVTRMGSIRELPLADAYAAMNSKFWGATESRAPPKFEAEAPWRWSPGFSPPGPRRIERL